ncbi:MAG: ribosome-binding factor A [Planctomycetaceae bacterium]|nr:ribosome-binding factor A [Planctomycetaceae bacterium]
MSKRRRHSKPQDLCGQLGPDDAVDPREFFDRRSRGRGDRKARQLCRQVSQTLSYVLSGECDDDTLRSLYVESVDPAPDASRLLVTVSNLDKDDDTPAIDILTKLTAVTGKLRSEVAASISRRKTPELIFNVVQHDDITAPHADESDDVEETE